MIRVQFHSNSLAPNPSSCISISSSSSSPSKSCSDQISNSNARILPLIPKSQTFSLSSKNQHCPKPLVRFCKASLGRRNADGKDGSDDDGFVQASLLFSETVRHYNLWKQGFVENTKWHSPGQEHLFSHQRNEDKSNASSLGHGILRRFQIPTIFLKIACDGDLLLPIIVGEFAIIQLINALSDDQHKESPDQFQFAKSIALKFGYEVKMVRITAGVVSTYHARIYLGKATNGNSISIDARPSDAINVAEKFKAPIYVSKEVVLKDAIKIVYGKWKGSGKTVYDVSLDSAVEGHDPLADEIDMIKKIKTAVLEERYEEAAMWRDKLAKLRMQSHGTLDET